MKILSGVVLFILIFSIEAVAQNYTLSGYIKEEDSGEALIGATIINAANPSVGQVSNVYGFYSLQLPAGTYTVRVSYVGHQAQEVEIDLNSSKTLNFNLKEETSSLEEVVVKARRRDENVSFSKNE